MLVVVHTLMVLVASAYGGALDGWSPGIEGQDGVLPAAWAPDGSQLAVTGWDRAGLEVIDLEGNTLQTVSSQRGAGFHPLWLQEGLFFKEVIPQGDGSIQRLAHWEQGLSTIIDEGRRIGDASMAAGYLAWTHDEALRLRNGATERQFELPTYVNLAELDSLATQVAINDADGRMGVLSIQTGHIEWLTTTGGHSHPAWSSDGAYLMFRTPGGFFTVYDMEGGRVVWEGEGFHPVWIPQTHRVVFDRSDADLYEVRQADLWLLDVDRLQTTALTRSSGHERYPLPTPGGDGLAYTDTRDGSLWCAPLNGVILGVPTLIADANDAPGSPPVPAPPKDIPLVDVPYLHQLWDTPDYFPGYWSCGPTSCVMVAQKYQLLPDHDIIVSNPYSHTSKWGWYIPEPYDFEGYTYDIWGVTYGDYWCQGAHGFICREYGGASGEYMIDFMNQHGLESWWGGVEWSTLAAELDAGYAVVTLAIVLECGHLIVSKGYRDDHTFVVNDPYGDANNDWGQYDGENAVYDWQGYNNGHQEIEVTYLFGSRGPDVLNWDAELVSAEGPVAMLSGQVRKATLLMTNVGSETWWPDEVFVAPAGPVGRTSEFADMQLWPADDRAATVSDLVGTGSSNEFAISLVAPEVDVETTFDEGFQLIQEGHAWFGPGAEELTFSIKVLPASANQAPVAKAEVTVLEEGVILDGEGSFDHDGEIVSWVWETPDGELEGEVVEWTLTGREATVKLTVTDDLGAVGTTSVDVGVKGCGCQSGVGRSWVWLAISGLLILVHSAPRCWSARRGRSHRQ